MDYTTLIDLVCQYSPSGEEGAASAWLVERMKSLGYDRAFVDPAGNACGLIGSGPKQIVLLGHIDTVPGRIPVRVEGETLHGRGSVDAKGPLACFTDAAAAVGVRPGWQLVVIGAVDEERDSVGVRSILGQYHPDFLIVGEPNRWDRVALGYKGSAGFRLRAEREQAHSASAGETAGEVAVNAWLKVKALADAFNQGKSRMFDQIQLTLNEIHTGGDGLRQWAELGVGARLPVGLTPEEWYDQLRQTVPDLSLTQANYPIGAWQCDKNTALVRALLAGIRSQGGTPSFVYKTGTADLNIAAPVWDCPSAVYGPGDSALDHTPVECISLGEYEKAVLALTAALQKLTAVD